MYIKHLALRVFQKSSGNLSKIQCETIVRLPQPSQVKKT